VKFGINGPYISGTNRERLLEWFRRVDHGPFESIATGERVLWPQIEEQAFLAAAAAVTQRVRVMSNILVLPMHAPVLLAKRLASIDVISGGRLILGVGAGGREADYRAAEMSFENRWRRIDEAVATLRRIWAGEPPWEGADPVGPMPVQVGGPPIYTSASGPTSLPRAARWADGWLGSLMMVELGSMTEAVKRHVGAWEAAGRSDRPYMVNAVFYALGENSKAVLNDTSARYSSAPPGTPSSFGDLPLHNVGAIRRAVDDCETAGFDEVMFVPLSDDLSQLDLLEEALSGR
jgi:alkanesulfonate monooxygenase SsuD/methylene tetrahydromethanopterin reductase-like flavin-dependent oxidoreductase (luciferase family)